MRYEHFHGAREICNILNNSGNHCNCGCNSCGCNTCNNSCVGGCNSCGCNTCNNSCVGGCNSCGNSCNNMCNDVCGDSCNDSCNGSCNDSCVESDSCNCCHHHHNCYDCSDLCGTSCSCQQCSCGCGEENSHIMGQLLNTSCSQLSECQINNVIADSNHAVLTICQNGSPVSMPVFFERRSSCGCGGSTFLLFANGCMCNINSAFSGRNASLLFTNSQSNCVSNVSINGTASFVRTACCASNSINIFRFIPQSVNGTFCCSD